MRQQGGLKDESQANSSGLKRVEGARRQDSQVGLINRRAIDTVMMGHGPHEAINLIINADQARHGLMGSRPVSASIFGECISR